MKLTEIQKIEQKDKERESEKWKGEKNGGSGQKIQMMAISERENRFNGRKK